MSADTRYCELLKSILERGNESKPRDMETLELLGTQFEIDMNSPIIASKERGLNYKFMAAEAAWMLSGKNDVKTISKYCKNIAKFSDDGDTFAGAYGPRIIDQIGYIVKTLKADRDSRQAVINIWRERPGDTKDCPCTLSLQFIIRLDKIFCIATMRSSDAWLGVPYDIFNFSAISNYLTYFFTDLKLGLLKLNAGSCHLYQNTWLEAREVIREEQDSVDCSTEDIFDVKAHTKEDFIQTLWNIADGKESIWDV